MLQEGDIIKLNYNNKDYIVMKNIVYNNENYYYLMTTTKPVEVAIVKIVTDVNGNQLIENVTEKEIVQKIIELTN